MRAAIVLFRARRPAVEGLVADSSLFPEARTSTSSYFAKRLRALAR